MNHGNQGNQGNDLVKLDLIVYGIIRELDMDYLCMCVRCESCEYGNDY